MTWLIVGDAVLSLVVGAVAGAVATVRKLPVILARMSPNQIDELAARTAEVKRSA
jgi:hypothetical protein